MGKVVEKKLDMRKNVKSISAKKSAIQNQVDRKISG